MGEAHSDIETYDRRKARILKNAGQNCIVLFVLFVISVMAFGRCPVTRTVTADGTSVKFDILSAIGVLGGLYALGFVALRLRAIVGLPVWKRFLGLIGGAGLTVHLIVAVASVAIPSPAGEAVQGRGPFAPRGPERWEIDGCVHHIESTYYLHLTQGLQYTIEFPCTFQEPLSEMDDGRALKIAFPLMRHAYEKQLYKRATIRKFGEGVLSPSRIGVVLSQRTGAGRSGYRVALTIDQIRRRIEPHNAQTRKQAATGRAGDTSRVRRIAFAPLKNRQPSPEADWIGRAVCSSLGSKLGGIPGLVTAGGAQISNAIERCGLKGTDLTERQTAARLGKFVKAERIIVGSYYLAGGKIRFDVDIVDVENAIVVSTAGVDTEKRNIFSALSQLAHAVIASFDRKIAAGPEGRAVDEAPRSERVVLTEAEVKELGRWGTADAAAYEAAGRAMAADDLEKRILWYGKAIQLDGQYARAYNARGVAYARKGQYDKAIDDCAKAIELDARIAAAYSNRGAAYWAKGWYNEAVRDFNRAIELDSEDAATYVNRGYWLMRNRDFHKAMLDFGRAIDLNPGLGQAYGSRGFLHMRMGQIDQALRDFDRALELEPNDAVAYGYRAEVCYSKGWLERAKADAACCQKLGGKVSRRLEELLRNSPPPEGAEKKEMLP